MGFSSVWGYWISAWLGNVGYFVLAVVVVGALVAAYSLYDGFLTL